MGVYSANRRADIKDFGMSEDRMYLATRAWLMWLQGLFSTRPPGKYKWSANETETEILIHDHNPVATEKTNKRPIITTTRGAAKMMGASRDQTLERNFSGNEFKITDVLNSTMTLTCIAREGVEAQAIAYLVLQMIPVFKPTIMKVGRMHWIGNEITLGQETSHGAIVPGSSVPSWRAVQVNVPFATQDVVSVEKGFYNVLRAVNLTMGLPE